MNTLQEASSAMVRALVVKALVLDNRKQFFKSAVGLFRANHHTTMLALFSVSAQLWWDGFQEVMDN